MIKLSTSVTSLRMVGETYARKLKRLGIETVGDLLYHVPFRYENFSLSSKIALLQLGEKVTVIAEVTSIKNIYTKHGKRIQKTKIADETGEIEIIWYNQPFLVHTLKPGLKISIAGEVKQFGHNLIFESPDYEVVKPTYPNKPTTDNRQPTPVERSPFARATSLPHGVASTGQATNLVHTGRLVPIYPETEGVSSKWLRSRIFSLLYKFFPEINESLPSKLLTQFNLMSEKEAIYKIHFPSRSTEEERARKRLAFDELLILQLAAKIRQKQWQKDTIGLSFNISKYKHKIAEFINNLPFQLTNAQKKAVAEILTDLSKDKPMNRLLEGDVGSGKTVVATIAMYICYLNGFKSMLMAPTEILAQQHYQTIKKLLTPYKIKVGLLTGTKKVKKEGSFDIIIGTHAILFTKKTFPKLGLVVIDEQQRFGVEQRSQLRQKGENPHLLSMTATPIPRTIALTLYADLDLSIIEEMPKGRLPVKTWVVPPEKREAAYGWIKKQIIDSKLANKQKQAFIICPLIEESETLSTVKAATREYERLKTEFFADLSLGLLHGRLKQRQKEKIFKEMKRKAIDILVATPVVEVGIDIPQATIIMIETAERFGLAQLHQLRGRVGRREEQSYCLLFSDSESPNVFNRLKLLERTFSGPKLAELDLKLRGAGELFGTKQHGIMKLNVASLVDLPLIEETKKATKIILSEDFFLSQLPLLREKVQKYTIKDIAPD